MRRRSWVGVFLMLGSGCSWLSGCAWFQTPLSMFPPVEIVSSDTLGVVGAADSVAAEPDTTGLTGDISVADSSAADSTSLSVIDTTDTEGQEPWVFEGKTLKATNTSAGIMHQATFPKIRHGTLLLTGDNGSYLRDGEVGTLIGNVTFKERDMEGVSERATYSRLERKLTAEGRVRLWSDSLWVAAPRLDYDRRSKMAEMRGGVTGQDGDRLFSSRRMEWNQDTDELILLGDAQVEESDGTMVAGQTILYDIHTKIARVKGRPELILSSTNDIQTRLQAEELWLIDPNAYARGSVIVSRGDIKATGDSVAYFGDENRAILLGSPKVDEPNGTLWADTLFLGFGDDEALEVVDAVGHAGLRYTPIGPDRLGEVSEVEAEKMRIFFEDGSIDHLTATLQAKSLYRSAPTSDEMQGENIASGDTIIIQMGEDNGVDWVRIIGHAQGTYTFGGKEAEPDSVAVAPDSVATDPGETSQPESEKVLYEADEVLFTFDDEVVEMTGSAKADYDPMILTADVVRFHLRNRYLEAEGNPSLQDRSNSKQEDIVGVRMDYNLETKEGRVKEGRTQTDNGYVFAEELRQVGKGDFLARSGRMTSCSFAEEGKDPHFHFGSDRMRIYLDDKVVAKPITLYIRDVPVFKFPFYVFPIRKGRQSGFLTPQFGFGLGDEDSRFVKKLGYYWATNDYMDLEVRTDWYDRDNKFVPAALWRYKWLKNDLNGNVSLRHLRSTRQSLWDFSMGHWMTWNDWRITATGEYRDQDFRSEEAVTGNFGQSVDRILKNSLNLSRRLNFGSLRLSAKTQRDLAVDAEDGHDDNVISETLPEYSLVINNRNFGRLPDENGEGGFLPLLATTSWSLSSSGRRQNFRNEVTHIKSTETGLDTLVTQENTHQTKADHRLSISDRRKLFGVFSVGPSFNLTEHWVDREFSAADTSMGFHRASTWNASMSANTQIFGTMGGVGPIESFRHVVQPRVSLQFSPDTKGLLYTGDDGVKKNRFPGVSGFERRSLGLSLDQNFMAKVRGQEGIKRVDLMSWNLAASYNLMDDETPFSDVSSQMSLRRIYGVTLNLNSTHDTYKQFRFDRFTVDGAFGFSGVLPGGDRAASPQEEPDQRLSSSLQGLGGDVYDPDRREPQRTHARNLSYRANFSYSLAGSRALDDSFETRSTLRSSFQVQLTENWSLNYSNLWRISDGEISGERFSLGRDLHCWEAHVEGNRVGDNLSFYFRINIKDLQDIKVEQGRQGAEFGGLSRILP